MYQYYAGILVISPCKQALPLVPMTADCHRSSDSLLCLSSFPWNTLLHSIGVPDTGHSLAVTNSQSGACLVPLLQQCLVKQTSPLCTLEHSGDTLGDKVFETLGQITIYFLALEEHQKHNKVAKCSSWRPVAIEDWRLLW